MKQKIRRNTFETNSSSVHSIVIDTSGREPSQLPIDNDGYILTDYETFDKNTAFFTSQEAKLSYLITNCYYLARYGDLDEVYESYAFQRIQEAICKYTGCKGIKILAEDEPYIDHQSIPEYGEIELVNIYDDDAIINFVFNKYITLKTDCD